MSRDGGTVEVIPSSVHTVLDRVRGAARDCFTAALDLNGRTPLMPPAYTYRYRETVESIASRLLALAADYEWLAVTHGLRLTLVEGAAGERLETPLGDLVGDVGWAARTAVTHLSAEQGTDLLADPAAQEVHEALGVRDMLASAKDTLATMIMGSPMYGTRRPGGHQARQELVAMAINASRSSLLWLALEPEDGARANADLVGKVLDVQDLANDDPFRWAGHMVSGYALGKFFDGFASLPDDAPLATAVPASVREAGAGAYQGVSQANKVPSTRSGGRARSLAGKAIVAVEDRAANFLVDAVP